MIQTRALNHTGVPRSGSAWCPACPAVAWPAVVRHCWTSQQWHPAPGRKSVFRPGDRFRPSLLFDPLAGRYLPLADAILSATIRRRTL